MEKHPPHCTHGSTPSYEELLHCISTLEEKIKDLEQMNTMLSMCCSCQRVKNDRGIWERIDDYIERCTGTRISHGYCPDCAENVLAGLHK